MGCAARDAGEYMCTACMMMILKVYVFGLRDDDLGSVCVWLADTLHMCISGGLNIYYDLG